MFTIEYFYNPVCPYCPAAKNLLMKVIKDFKDINLIDVDTYTEKGIDRGLSLNIMAVPAIAINGVVKLIGWPFEDEDLLTFIEEASDQ